MATAKRIAQSGKYEAYEKVVTAHRYLPQPDRIVLDLSVEEAHAVLYYDWHKPRLNTGLMTERARHVARVMHDALYPTSGTGASPAQDVCDQSAGIKGTPSADYR